MHERLIINDLLTPIGAFLRLRDFQPVFLFESAGNARGSGRYSFIGLDPVRTVLHRAAEGGEDFYNSVREVLAGMTAVETRSLRLPSGLVGFAGQGIWKRSVCDSSDGSMPDALFVVPRYLVVFDHLDHSLSLYRTDGGEVEAGLSREVIAALRAGAGAAPRTRQHAEPSAAAKDAEIRDGIEALVARVREGEILMAPQILTLRCPTDLDPFQVYRGLRFLHPSPYLYYLAIGGVQIMGSSPDSLVHVEGDQVKLSPYSALRPRPGNKADEAREIAEMAADAEAAAEHALIVEQAREDLSGVAAPGSLRVGRSHAVELSSHEMHLVTDLECTREAGTDQLDLFRAVFPAARCAGVPKRGTVGPHADVNDCTAGLQGGAAGYFSVNGALDFTPTDRALVIRDGLCSTDVTIHVTATTNPEAAAAKLKARGAAILRSLDIAQECL